MSLVKEQKKVLVFEDDPTSVHLLKSYFFMLNPEIEVVLGTPADVHNLATLLEHGFVCAIINGRLWNHTWSEEMTEGETIATRIHEEKPLLPLIFFSNRAVRKDSEHVFTAVFESKIYRDLISLPLLQTLASSK